MPLSAAIFRRGGPKRELFDEGADAPEAPEVDDEQELDGKLANVRELVAAEKAGKDMSAAIWRPRLRLAELVLAKKVTGVNMGFIHGKKTYLHIEEAVFLVDRADLLLFVEEDGGRQRLLSLQEAYELMISECPGGLGPYILYSYLQRSGYIVRRHPTRWIMEHGEDPTTVWSAGAWRKEEAAITTPAAAAAQRGRDALGAASAASAGTQQPRSGGDASSSQPGEVRHQRAWWRKADASHPNLAGVPQAWFDDLPEAPAPIANPGDTLRLRFPRLRAFDALPPDLHLGELSSSAYLLFDVYKPGAHVSRRGGIFPPVAFHLCLSREGPPSLQDMQAADAQAAAAAEGRGASIAAAAAASAGGAEGAAGAAAGAGGWAPPRLRPAAVKYCKIESGDITFYGITRMQMLGLI